MSFPEPSLDAVAALAMIFDPCPYPEGRALVHQRTGRVLQVHGGQPPWGAFARWPCIKLACALPELHQLFPDFDSLALVLPARGC